MPFFGLLMWTGCMPNFPLAVHSSSCHRRIKRGERARRVFAILMGTSSFSLQNQQTPMWPDLLEAFLEAGSFGLSEGSIYERLRRHPAIVFDPYLAHAAL